MKPVPCRPMIFTPIIHTISDAEIAEIKAMGFSFEGAPDPPARFISTNFPNFDLLTLLQEVDRHLGSTTNEPIQKKVFLKVGAGLPDLQIQYNSEDYNDENLGLAFMRKLAWEDGGLMATHQYFRIPKLFRNKGIAKEILRALLQQYVNMGVKKILLRASLEDGGLVWAKLHFLGTDKSDVDQILGVAKATLSPKELQFVEKIYVNYYSQYPDGQSFPMYKWAELAFMESILRKSAWNGAVDLTNPQEFTKFI
jgi:GNAT superfamily N-acetyltransferase